MFEKLFDSENKHESWSYKIIVLATIMIGVGIILGSFIQYTVILATVGAFLLLVGIVLYIFSQLKGDRTSQVSTNTNKLNDNPT